MCAASGDHEVFSDEEKGKFSRTFFVFVSNLIGQ